MQTATEAHAAADEALLQTELDRAYAVIDAASEKGLLEAVIGFKPGPVAAAVKSHLEGNGYTCGLEENANSKALIVGW